MRVLLGAIGGGLVAYALITPGEGQWPLALVGGLLLGLGMFSGGY